MATAIYLSQLFEAGYPDDENSIELSDAIIDLLKEGVMDLEKSKITQLELES